MKIFSSCIPLQYPNILLVNENWDRILPKICWSFSCFKQGQCSTLVLVEESALICCRQRKKSALNREKAGAAAAQDAGTEGGWPQGELCGACRARARPCPCGWASFAGAFVTARSSRATFAVTPAPALKPRVRRRSKQNHSLLIRSQ